MAERERQQVEYTQTYLVAVQNYSELQTLEKINIANGTSLISINKLNALSVVNNNKLNDANKSITTLSEVYRAKHYNYKNKVALLLSHAQNVTELDFNELYLRVINCKTGIPSYVLKNTCARLQSNCNTILQKIADFTIIIDYDKDIKIYTIENDIRIPAQMGSGMQKFVLDLIIRITLTEISSVSSPKMLFVDEGFGSLDRDNFIAVANILQKLKDKFDSLIIISHISELHNYVDLSINITRKNYLSNVQYGTLSTAQKTVALLNMTVADNQRVTAFKEKTKSEKHEKKVAVTSATDVTITNYYATHGGAEKVLLRISENTVHCYACNKDYVLKKNVAERHIASATHRVKHNKYIISLL